MQNNPRHDDDLSRTDFGKKFTDRAWADMHRLLDEEMPVTERRRPIGWWWAFGMVGLVALVALFYAVNTGAEQASPKSSGPVAEAPSGIEKMAGEVEVASAETSTFDASHNEPLSGAKIIASNKTEPQPFLQKNIETFTQNTDNQHFTIKENTLPPSILATAEKQDDPQKTTLLNEAKPDESALSTSERATLILAEKLDVLSLGPFETEPSETPNVETKCKKPRRIGWAAYAAAYAQPGRAGASGMGGGVLATLPLGKSRFSVETGLGYSYFQQPVEVVTLNREDLNDPGIPVGGGNSGGFENLDLNNTPYVAYDYSNESLDELNLSGGRASSPEILHLHYLNIPLEIHFRHHRWWTFAGANTGILLASSSSLANGGIFDGRTNSDPTSFSPNAEQSGSTKIRAFDFAATGGIGFDVSPRIGIDLRYQHGLNDVLKNNGEEDVNRFWRAGVRWRF